MDDTMGATGLLVLSNRNRLAESGANTQSVAMANIPHQFPTDISARSTRFHAKATIAQQAANRRGTIWDFAKLAKMRARCRGRRKLGAADSGERAGRGRC